MTCMSDEKCVKPSRYIQTGVTELQVITNYTVSNCAVLLCLFVHLSLVRNISLVAAC